MDDDVDKRLNGRTGSFKHGNIDAQRQVRLLRLSNGETRATAKYGFEAVPFEELGRTRYKALSYMWGRASEGGVYEIRIDGQPFFIRRNLCDFLTVAAANEEQGLFFIDAICINQLDHDERQAQVQQMARIFRQANEVVAWLGPPDAAQFDNVKALSQAGGKECTTSWTAAQWEGFRYLSYHPYWRRIWIVQEVLLASKMTVWCGPFKLPLTILGRSPPHPQPQARTKVAADGRPSSVKSDSWRLRSPAENVISHRLRQVIRPHDAPIIGARVETLDEMVAELAGVASTVETYQSQVPDLAHEVVGKFGKFECSDPRDRLYGFLGLLKESSRKMIKPDYEKGVSHAFYQALKVGLHEILAEQGPMGNSQYVHVHVHGHDRVGRASLVYYCDVRDAFGFEDRESMSILRRVLRELRFRTWMEDALFEYQWAQQFGWRPTEMSPYSASEKVLLSVVEEDDSEHPDSSLFRFHARQRRMVEGLLSWHQSHRQRRRGWRQV